MASTRRPRHQHPTVVLFRVVDPTYPRARRVRQVLDEVTGGRVLTVVPSRASSFLVRCVIDAVRLWAGSQRGDVILLGEMQLASAPVAALVGRLRRCRVVVDGFIGLYETYVEDWQVTRPGTLRARRYGFQDAMALWAADFYLVDTEPRAAALRRRVRGRRQVVALQVGAPSWARPLPRDADTELRILYYGGYIPLHGIGTVVRALAVLARSTPFRATFVGAGAAREGVRADVLARGLGHRVTFLDPVPESDLVDLLAGHDVVLGVFGTSRKAAGVVANKVWQGLACGRRVVTRRSEALAPLRPVVGDALVEIEPGDPTALASALARAAELPSPQGPRAAERLEELVDTSFDELRDWLVRAGVAPSGQTTQTEVTR